MSKKLFSALLISATLFAAVPAFADSNAVPNYGTSIDNSYVAYAAKYRVTIQRDMEMRQVIVVSDSADHAKWAVQDANWGWTVVKVEFLGSI